MTETTKTRPFNELSYSDAIQIWLDNAEYLNAQHQAMVTSAEKIAKALDTRLSASLQAELTKIVRVLESYRPSQAPENDQLQDFLAGVQR